MFTLTEALAALLRVLQRSMSQSLSSDETSSSGSSSSDLSTPANLGRAGLSQSSKFHRLVAINVYIYIYIYVCIKTLIHMSRDMIHIDDVYIYIYIDMYI